MQRNETLKSGKMEEEIKKALGKKVVCELNLEKN